MSPAPLVAERYRDATAPVIATDANPPADLIDLSIGDPDLTTSELIIDAAMADAKAGHTHYTPTLGDPELRAEIQAYWRDEYGHEPALDEVMVTTSACHGMFLALQATLNPGDEVLIPEPCFFVYPEQVQGAGATPVFVPTTEAEGFQVMAERLEAARTDRTRALILNTPNNPTGICQRRATLERIAAWAQEHDILVFADDIYTLYAYAEPFLPIATLPGMAERTITVQSFSKDYVMTGWRIGSVVAPAAVVQVMRRINEGVVYSAPAPSQRAALHALRLRREIQPELHDLYRDRLATAVACANATPRMHAVAAEGTFYVWVNVADTGLTSVEVATRLLEDAHVKTIPGSAFGPSGEGYLRLAATRSDAEIREAFARIARSDMFGPAPSPTPSA